MGPLPQVEREDAARLMAERRMTNAEIAAQVGIGERTLYKWLKNKRFVARRDQLLQERTQKALSLGMAAKVNQLIRMNERVEGLQQIVSARANDEQHKQLPGGETGLLVIEDIKERKIRRQKRDAHGQPIPGEFETATVNVPFAAVDTGLLAAERASIELIAEITGQRVQKHEVTFKRPEEMSDEEIELWLKELDKRLGAAPVAVEMLPGGSAPAPQVVEIIPPAGNAEQS